ncbi:MAG: ABC-F family ATP-binding cassette domain-containing protein, partial [Polyangiaceae bacterium]
GDESNDVAILSARDLTKAYGQKPLFANATFHVQPGDKVALLGSNGTGKSTLLRVIAGLEPADSGAVERQRDATILTLSQEPVLDLEKTPREIAREGIAAWSAAKSKYDEISSRIGEGESLLLVEQAALAEDIERHGGWSRDHEVDEILEHLGVIDVDRKIATMSGGEKRRVALARILVAKPDLAILDEPTNHLDADTIVWLENFLVNDFKGAVLIVTHDRYVLEAVANRILDLENGVLTEYLRKNDGVGAFTDYLEQRAERDAHAERVEQNRQNFLRREIEWLRRGPKARSTKQKARIDRAHQTIAVDAPRERGKVDLEGLETGAARLGGTVVELEDVSLELGKKKLISHLTMHLRKGERIGIIGRNGAGKTSLLRLVTKELEPTTGKVTQGRQTNVAYFDQSRSLLKEDWTVFDNVAEREGAIRTGAGQITLGDRTMELRAYLELFLFDAHAQRRKVSALSGGERARVTLALTLKHGDNVLLLDEPTNDLDIATLGALEDLLENWPGAVLVVSHDRFFLDRVATSILAFEGAGNVELYGGNWQSYFDRKAEIEAMRAPIAIREAPAVTIPAPPPAAAAAPKKKLTYAERIELGAILETIAEAETKVAELEKSLADPSLYAAPDRTKSLKNELEFAQANVARLTARWEDLEARK